ncbi:fimbria/pilus outer membrane usher protein [Klebsiella indica]|nr:fimbria/pilus outer membrane usher protein [Klebsiella indica]
MLLPKKTPLAFLLSGLCTSSACAELFFPPEMISADGDGIADLSQFRADGSQLPGVYDVDIYLNQTFARRQSVRFDAIKPGETTGVIRDDTGLAPCLSRKFLGSAGVKVEMFPALMALDEEQCVNPAEYVPGAFSQFDFSRLRLDLSVPQRATRNRARGDIDPEQWDEGINAALLSYRFSGTDRSGSRRDNRSYFLSLGSGLNLGAWRLRDDRNWNYYDSNDGNRHRWQRIRTYAERTVAPLRSTLVLGESTTGSEVFDSLGFTGVQLSSNDNMYPETLRGFAPIVRGMAESNAEVSIRQNGYIIYRTTIAPGAFEITDLSPVNSSGDLEVSIREAGGSVRVFTVPYTSLPTLQREGRIKYSLTAGNYRGSSDHYDKPSFAQGTLIWGLPHDTTLYGGAQFSSDYLAVQSGVGVNMGRTGGVSVDITHADSTLADGSGHQGQSLRFLYAFGFNPTGTTFRLTGYRYSTRGFHTLDETALKTMSGRLYDHTGLDNDGNPVTDTRSDYYNLNNSKRARIEADISQSLGDYGSVWLTGMRQTYWNTSAGNASLRIGYSNSLGPVNYSLNYGLTRYKNDNAPSYTDRSISLSLSVPFDRLLGRQSANPVYATFSSRRDSNNQVSQQSGLSGKFLRDGNLDWNVSQGYSRSQGTSGNVSLNYRGIYGNGNLGYSHSRDWRQISYGLAGGALLHRNGLTIGQPLGDTTVLIATPGVPNVGVKNEPGVFTDWRGYTIKPYASAYRENRIQVDTESLDEHTDVDNSVARIVPTKGAVVRAEFKARRGYRVLMTMTHNGKPLPFGTMVTAGESSGIVADGGQVYLSGLEEKGEVTVRWGDGAGQQCRAEYQLTEADRANAVIRTSGVCR